MALDEINHKYIYSNYKNGNTTNVNTTIPSVNDIFG